ncbi:glycosyl hydrolase family 28-related protein [Tistrella bauzanensis]
MSTDASDVIYQYPASELDNDTYLAYGSFVTGVANGTDTASTITTTARDLATRLNAQYLDARDFGAVGDGVTDDTAALRALFDARFDLLGWGKTSGTSAPETWADAWKVVMLPAGTYRLSRALSIRSNTIVFAYGAVLKALPVGGSDPENVWEAGYWDARTNGTKSGIGHLGGLVSIRHAQNVHWHGGTLDANQIMIRGGFNALGISAPYASSVGRGEKIIVRDVRLRGCRTNLTSNTTAKLPDIFPGGGGKGITLQLGQNDIILQNLLIEDCDVVATIEGTESLGRELRQVIVDTVIARDCKYGFIVQGVPPQMKSSIDLKNIWLHNVGNAAYDASPDGYTHTGDFIDDPRRIGGVLTMYNANNMNADIRITNDNETGLTGTGGSDLIRGTARNSHIRIQGYVARLNHLWNTTLTQQDARISSITVINGGSGYTAGDTVVFTNDVVGGGPTSHQVGTLTVDANGAIESVALSDQALYLGDSTADTGKGYQRPPIITVTSATGTGAVLTPVMNYPFSTDNKTGGVFDCVLEAELEVGEHVGKLVKHLPHVRPTGLDIRAAIRSADAFSAPVNDIYDFEAGDTAGIQARNRFEIIIRNLQKVIRGRFDRDWDAATVQAMAGPLVELGKTEFAEQVRFDATIDNRFINHRLNVTGSVGGTTTTLVDASALPAGFRGLVTVTSLGLIPSPMDGHPCAHDRMPMDMMSHG